MKKLISFALVVVLVFSMTACGCDHVAGDFQVISVNPTDLTMERVQSCTQCEKQLDTETSPVGIAPVNGVMPIGPAAWFECLTTNIKTYDSSGMLVPMDVESDDGALLRSIVSPSGFKSVISFFDKDDNVITNEQSAAHGAVHRIRVEAQFDNNTATTFYTMLMLMAMTNNCAWENESLNALAKGIMGGESLTDNGYTYTMEIISAATHTVVVHIEAE